MKRLLYPISVAALVASCASTPDPKPMTVDAVGAAHATIGKQSEINGVTTFMIDWPGKTMADYRVIRTGELRKVWTEIERVAKKDQTLYPDLNHPEHRLIKVDMLNGIPLEAQVEDQLNGMVARFNDAYKTATGTEEPYFKNLAKAGFAPSYLVTSETLETSERLYSPGNKFTKEFSCVRFEWIAGKLIAIYNYKLVAENPNHEPENLADLKGTKPTYCVVARFTLNEK